MATVLETTTARKPAIAFYGWLRETHGIFLQADGVVSFRDSDTETWEEVTLEDLTRWAVLNGRVDISDMQMLLDGNRVVRCSQTLCEVA
jgi:hypothetical protein